MLFSFFYRSDNLAEHGIHPRYMHALINSPLLFGPLVAFAIVSLYIAYHVKNKGMKCVIWLRFAKNGFDLELTKSLK